MKSNLTSIEMKRAELIKTHGTQALKDKYILELEQQIADLKQHICQSADFKINIAKAKNTLHIE